MQDQEPARKCFVIMPFGEKDDHGQLIDFDTVYRTIIKPAVEELNAEKISIKCIRCDEVEQAGLIHERMLQFILDADVAVVDITTQNPNVFYELGVRHALHDRVTVLIRREGTKNPFNIGGMNTIEYSLEESKVPQARKAITSFVRNGLLSSSRDSLVYAVLPGLEVTAGRRQISDYHVYKYLLTEHPHKELWLVTGDLRHVNLNAELHDQPIDIWVSSENINMQMARVFDNSVSALIRYLGAKKDEIGEIVEDCIADELRAKMRGRQQVNPGTVVATGSGWLCHTHKVRRIYHAATVYGTIGGGFFPIDRIENCVTAALAQADVESGEERNGQRPHYTSILFPLFGTGTGGGRLIDSAKKQLGAAISYMRARAPVSKLERVCFLAPTEPHLDAMRLALAEADIEPVTDQAQATGAQPGAGTAPQPA
jgi:O-acetyl-ADP-ribose deacetylase (regulator of RNase III)